MRLTDYFLVIPDVPLMIVIAALFGRSTWNIIVIIGIIYWTFTARLIRAQTKSVRERVYVQRARALGARNSRLVLRHVLPQVTPLLIANTVLLIAYAIFAETFITFLGLGRSERHLVGSPDRERVHGRRDHQRGLVGDHPARAVRHVRRPRVHDPRAGDGGRAQPASAHRPRVGPALPGASRPAAAGAMTPPLLEVEDLNVWFDLPNERTLHAVQGVSFSIDPGTRLGMVGESGCGKTTTVLALMGLLPPTASVSGRILLDGDGRARNGGEQTISPHRWKDIAMVFQGAMNAFDPVRRVGEQIAEPMELHGLREREGSDGAGPRATRDVGIAPNRARSYPHELSGGMRQRAAIAMALACNPRVLLADEPTTALDVMVQAQILDLLTHLSDELGLALVFVTHDLPIVAQTCTHAAVMYAGKIVEQGPDRRALPRDAASLHAAALGGHARPRVARRRGLDPRRSTAARPRDRGLPVRTTLRPGSRHAASRSARSCGPWAPGTSAPATSPSPWRP